ncbi:hypothetical protein FA13DRAFT_1719018 [Coprinellus micaceus]|uniref:Uncharacterized protein n=1 Tax=Coprinellus micaceus TaxID=71717 RepID=A0A4Y7SCB6_COPMI|nr:hypothetical protein FA13DRAFT_1719018 [Coprinellus micaceus]
MPDASTTSLKPTRVASRYHPYTTLSPCAGRGRQATGPRPSLRQPPPETIGSGNVNGSRISAPRNGIATVKREESTNLLTSPNVNGGQNHRAEAKRGTRRRGSVMAEASTAAAPLLGRVQGRTRANAASEATRLNTQFAAEINTLKERIAEIERSERRLKLQLQRKAESVKDAKVEKDEARTEWLKAEEKLEEMERTVETLRREAERYRGWWLTEYYSLKVVLGLVPNKQDVEVIASSARGRFVTYSEAAKKQHITRE